MTENEKLRPLLAEPVADCVGCAAALTARDEARALREVDAEKARREVLLLKTRVSDLKHVLGTDAIGWFDRFKRAERERDEARAELASWRGNFDGPLAFVRDHTDKAFRRGAEAMREAAAKVDPYELHLSGASFAKVIDTGGSLVRIMQEGIRALPVPEDKP